MSRPINIHESAYKGDFELVRSKLEENPLLLTKTDEVSIKHKKYKINNIFKNGRLLLHWSAVGGNFKLVSHLIDLGSQIDCTDDTDTTPLILSSSAGHDEIVALLLRKGANVNHQSSEGHSALQYAASKGKLEICIKLLEYNANVNIADRRGATPLHRAASKGNLEVVRILLEKKNILNLNAHDAYGSTPLHLACEEDRQDIAKLLVQNGADLDSRNREQKTPLDLCTVHLRNALKSLISD